MTTSLPDKGRVKVVRKKLLLRFSVFSSDGGFIRGF